MLKTSSTVVGQNSVAIFFVLSLLSGFAIYSPWLYRWLTPLFGGGPRTRLLHPWFGLLFDLFFFGQFLNWLAPMTWTAADRRWLKRLVRLPFPGKPGPRELAQFVIDFRHELARCSRPIRILRSGGHEAATL